MSAYHLICSLILWTKYCYYSELQGRKPWQRVVKHLPGSLRKMDRTWHRLGVPHPLTLCRSLPRLTLQAPGASLFLGMPQGLGSTPNPFVLFGFKVLCERGMLPPWLSVASREVAPNCHDCLEGDTARLCNERYRVGASHSHLPMSSACFWDLNFLAFLLCWPRKGYWSLQTPVSASEFSAACHSFIAHSFYRAWRQHICIL